MLSINNVVKATNNVIAALTTEKDQLETYFEICIYKMS